MKRTVAFLLAALMLFSMIPLASAENGLIETLKVNPYGGEEAAADTVSWLYLYGTYYMFLPGDADLSAAKVYYSAPAAVKLDGEEIASGGSAAAFTSGAHTLSCKDSEYPLSVMYGSSAPAVFISTESGSMAGVYADKEHKEPGTIRITNGDGTDAYSGKLDYIKGRGNSTWTWAKKPFNIKLNKKAWLFGMAKSKKWCLIACYIDNTLLRNDMVSDLANEVGISHTPRGQHVQ
ncbi:MAG: CotH kinase family protein, partial [Clostridia bacterium]|nr:CotH kinase family protein [Clostridia bacterium]